MSKMHKRTILIGLVMSIALSIATLLSFSFNVKQKTANAILKTETAQQLSDVSTLSVSWQPQGTSIKPMASSTDINWGAGINCGWKTDFNTGDFIQGGSEIIYALDIGGRGTTTDGVFNSNGQATSGTSVFTIKIGTKTASVVSKPGYRISKVTMGNEDINDVIELNFKYNNDIYSENISSVEVIQGSATVKTSDETLNTTPEILDPEYNGKLIFTAECELIQYDLGLYYSTNENASFQKVTNAGYNVETALNLNAYEATHTNTDIHFSSWVLNHTLLTKAGYEITDSVDDNYLTVSKTGVYLTIKYPEDGVIDGSKTLDGNTYYEIISVQGYGIIDQNDSNPTIRAKWAHLYDATIENNTTGWASDTYGNATLNDSTVGVKYGGVYYNLGSHVNDADKEGSKSSKTIEIANSNLYSFAFVNNYKSEFKTGSSAPIHGAKDAAGTIKSSFAVYNYGYTLTGWQIQFKYGTTPYYLNYNGSWSYQSGQLSISIDAIVGQKTGGIANLIDNIMPGGFTQTQLNNFGLTMIPQWSPVKVNLKCGGNTKEIDYNSTYENINNSLNQINVGQSVMYYTAENDGSVIALSGKWNYTTISGYVYQQISDGVSCYNLAVKPYFVDNMYKVHLTGVELKDGQYKMISSQTDYVFKNELTYSEKEYNYSNYSQDGYEYKTHASSGITFIDDYIDDLIDYQRKYESGVQGSFNILRKVYTNGTLVDNYTVNSGDTMYIYLTNNQSTGNLPIFDRTHYNHILWENKYSNYEYSTAEYMSDTDTENPKGYIDYAKDKNFTYHLSDGADKDYTPGTFEMIWCYSDGNSSVDGDNQCELIADYFRKYYYLDIQTIFGNNTEKIGDYGYITVQIDDTLDGGADSSYLVKFDKATNEIKIFYLLSGFTSLTESIKYSQSASEIKLYAGCDLTVCAYDQSQDSSAMQTGNYDSMIGYRYSTMYGAQNEGKEFEFTISEDYSKSVSGATIESSKYTCGSTITVYVDFEYIVYNFKVVLTQGSNAGGFTVAEISNVTYVTLDVTGVTNDKSYTIDYVANAGYTLVNEAFMLKSIMLESFTEGDQQHYFEINGTWLRENFYNLTSNNYALTNTDIGQININTENIPFGFGIKLYNLTNSEIGEFMIDANGEDVEGTTFVLNENGQYRTIPLSSLSQIVAVKDSAENIITYCIEFGGKQYALIANYWSVNNVETVNEKLKLDSFDFLLKNSTLLNRQYLIESKELSTMTGVGRGVIIPTGNRKVYMTLIVEELIELTIDVTGVKEGDAVVTTVKNGTNNSTSISGNMTGCKMYTYNGLSNFVTLSYNTAKYSGVKYTLNGVTTGNVYPQDFNFNNGITNPKLIIEYQEKTIKDPDLNSSESVTYKLEGIDSTRQALIDGGYLANDSLQLIKSVEAQTGLKVGDQIKYSYTVSDTDYEVKFNVNGTNISLDANVTNQFTYTLTNSDLQSGNLNIVINMVKRDNSKIEFSYILLNEDEVCEDDDYGTMKVTVKKNASSLGTTQEGKTVAVTAVEGNIVTLDIGGIANGYTYYAIQHNGDTKQLTQPQNNILTITTSYDPGDNSGNYGDSGRYYIYLNKVDVKVELDLSNSSLTNRYNAYWIEDGTRKTTAAGTGSVLSGLYLGKVVELRSQEQTTEKLKCFFYTKLDGTKVYLTEDGTSEGTSLTSFKITSQILADCDTTIKIGVDTYNKYKLDIKINGLSYIEERSYNTSDDQVYESGTYLIEGSRVYISVKPYDYNVDTSIGKYDINITGSISKTGDIVEDFEIVLDSNKSIVIAVTRKIYNVITNDYIYNTLEKWVNSSPDKIEVDYVNAPQQDTKPYGSIVTTVVNVPKSNDKELRTILLSGNENVDNIAVFVKDGNIYEIKKWTRNGNVLTFTDLEEGKTLTDYGFTIVFKTILGVQKIEISYKVLSDINIDCCYIAYKSITSELQ